MKWQPSILAKNPWMEALAGWWGHKELDATERLHFPFYFTLGWLPLEPSSPHHPERRTMAQHCLNTSLSLYHSKHNSQTLEEHHRENLALLNSSYSLCLVSYSLECSSVLLHAYSMVVHALCLCFSYFLLTSISFQDFPGDLSRFPTVHCATAYALCMR